MPKPSVRVQPVIVGLLQIGDPGEVVLVVPVARIGGPVAGRRENLGHEQTVAVVLVLHGDVVDVARVGAFAALRESDALQDRSGALRARPFPAPNRRRSRSRSRPRSSTRCRSADRGSAAGSFRRRSSARRGSPQSCPAPVTCALPSTMTSIASRSPVASEALSPARSRHREKPTYPQPAELGVISCTLPWLAEGLQRSFDMGCVYP